MKMYFPEIYLDELVYSWFGRFAVRSGYINSQLLQFLYCKRSDTPIKEFIGNLNTEARECIDNTYPLRELVLKHTMYPQYARFIPLEQRKNALYKLCHENCDMHHLFAVLPRCEKEQYLKYCPICSREDRQKYAETYWHRKHQIRNMRICPKHKCRLRDSGVPAKSMSLYSFVTAEEVIPGIEESLSVDDPLQIAFAEYAEHVFDSPVDFVRDIPISAILYHGMKDTEYMKSTGNSRYMTKFVDDMTYFYKKIELNEIATMSRIQKTLLTGRGYDFSIACQIAFFLGMKPEELTNSQLSEEEIRQEAKSHYVKANITPEWEEYDEKMSVAIESVAADIYSGAADNLGKPEKVTGKNICKILGIKEHRLENMPKSRAVLDKYTESYPESWARKLVWAYEWLENNNEDIFYWKHLRKLTGVKKERFEEIIPYLKKYADKDEVKLIVATVKGI